MRTLLILLMLSACGKGPSDGGPSKTRAAVSIFPLRHRARRIGGERVEAVLVLPAGRSEPDYDPPAKEVAKFADAKLGMAVGLGMDAWLARIVKGAAGDIEIVSLGDKVDPLAVELEEVGHEEEEDHEG